MFASLHDNINPDLVESIDVSHSALHLSQVLNAFPELSHCVVLLDVIVDVFLKCDTSVLN